MIFLKLQLIIALSISSNFAIAWTPWWYKCHSRPVQLHSHTCALLYEKEDCRGTPISIPDTKGLPYILINSLDGEVESLIVKHGCNLEVFSDPKCLYHKGLSFPFNNRYQITDLMIHELKDSAAKYLGKK